MRMRATGWLLFCFYHSIHRMLNFYGKRFLSMQISLIRRISLRINRFGETNCLLLFINTPLYFYFAYSQFPDIDCCFFSASHNMNEIAFTLTMWFLSLDSRLATRDCVCSAITMCPNDIKILFSPYFRARVHWPFYVFMRVKIWWEITQLLQISDSMNRSRLVFTQHQLLHSLAVENWNNGNSLIIPVSRVT